MGLWTLVLDGQAIELATLHIEFMQEEHLTEVHIHGIVVELVILIHADTTV